MWNSLAQTLIKITAPGVPDFYQGTEVWNFSLVDPDNRRPVDYAQRQRLLAALPQLHFTDDEGRDGATNGLDADPAERLSHLVSHRTDGRIKLYVTATALRARRADPELYRRGAYLPLAVAGTRAAHVFAFARTFEDRAAVIVVPRLTVTLLPDPLTAPIGAELWGDTRVLLPEGIKGQDWTNVFSGAPVVANCALALGAALERFPVALLSGSKTA